MFDCRSCYRMPNKYFVGSGSCFAGRLQAHAAYSNRDLARLLSVSCETLSIEIVRLDRSTAIACWWRLCGKHFYQMLEAIVLWPESGARSSNVNRLADCVVELWLRFHRLTVANRRCCCLTISTISSQAVRCFT